MIFSKKSVRTFMWRRNRWRLCSKNRGIYWPNSIPLPRQSSSPPTKFRQNKTGGERGIRTPDTFWVFTLSRRAR